MSNKAMLSDNNEMLEAIIETIEAATLKINQISSGVTNVNTVYIGTVAPKDIMGVDGDIYIQGGEPT